MKNTHVEYSSTERTPTVLPEFAELLPPLTEEQLDALEKDIVANGCYAPVIVNEDMAVIDGHNRKSICEKHNIPYRIAVFSSGGIRQERHPCSAVSFRCSCACSPLFFYHNSPVGRLLLFQNAELRLQGQNAEHAFVNAFLA